MAVSRYADVRRPEHSTLGDASDRFRLAPDAFTAGVQYALDTLIASAAAVAVPMPLDYLESRAVDILTNVHNGTL